MNLIPTHTCKTDTSNCHKYTKKCLKKDFKIKYKENERTKLNGADSLYWTSKVFCPEPQVSACPSMCTPNQQQAWH